MHTASVLLELGGVIVGLAVLARLAGRLGIPTIPLYLTVGLAFGRGGILPLITTEDFVEIGAEIGLILLLFMLGLEYTARELLATLRLQAPTGVLDLALNSHIASHRSGPFCEGSSTTSFRSWSPFQRERKLFAPRMALALDDEALR
ncbi:MAG TPA: cation:proton antiporter, partial [Actinomycetota bacterium]|nr:cation:proton antiporter [Actinomycetota bacterium]